jgi:hypothetical protein
MRLGIGIRIGEMHRIMPFFPIVESVEMEIKGTT